MRYAIATITAALLTLGMATGKADAQYTYRPQATTDDAGVVAMWYQKYLGRQPDAAGLQGWVNELRRGGRVEANILGSDEYFVRHGNTPESFITGLYVEILDRQPSVDEVRGWVVRLQQIGWDRVTMADEFLRAAQNEIALRNGAPAQPQYQPGYVPAGQPYYQPAYVPSTYVVPSVSYYSYGSGYYRPSYRRSGSWMRYRYWR